MAVRKTCFRLIACGILIALGVTFLITQKTRQPLYQLPVNKAWINTTVFQNYRTNEGPGENFNTSEVERIRKWVMTYFNPDTDLTIKKSQVSLGKSFFKYEKKPKKKVKIGQYYYQLLPESSPFLGKHFRSCAVVGNSGILLDSHCGPQIDSADFVFRSNLPDLEGFENDVGTKSNFTTMNQPVLPHEYNGYLTNTTIQEKFVKRLRLIHDQILHIPAMVTSNGLVETQFITLMIVKHQLPLKVTFAPTNVYQKLTKLWNDSEFKPNRPSTGNLLFALAACLCDQIHLYGYYPFSEDGKGRKIKYHYYGNIGSLKKHKLPEEYRAFLTFHQRKALVLHTEPCDDNRL
ncbi:CMP-N-acetylneuraminate-poly-alpha-2,8-sialyltransferase-like [Branchiostoma floridae x Branchiostoma belcheri]